MASKSDIQRTLEQFHIENWDFLIAADGSGSGWSGPIGWCAILIDKKTGPQEPLLGGLSSGTINMAELAPIIIGLRYYRECMHSGLAMPTGHLITDSKVTAYCGNNLYRKRANAELWAAFAAISTSFVLHWHLTPRDTNPLQILADRYAGIARKALKRENLKLEN